MIRYSKPDRSSKKPVLSYQSPPPADLFESVTGIPKSDVVKTSTESLKKYFATKVDANHMLDLASNDLWQGHHEKAARKILYIESDLCRWGMRDFASAIYLSFGYYCRFPLNTKSDGSFAATGFEISSEDYLKSIFYMFNLFKARNTYIQKNTKKYTPFPDFLKDPADFNKEFRHFLDLKNQAKAQNSTKPQKIDEKAWILANYLFYNPPCIIAYLSDILQSREYDSRLSCPFQRCRYYLHKIGEEKDDVLEGIMDKELFGLYSSPAFKDNSLPNWWMHLCLPSETEKLSRIDKSGYSAFENSAKNVSETFFTINNAFGRDYQRIRRMKDNEWKEYVQTSFPSSI